MVLMPMVLECSTKYPSNKGTALPGRGTDMGTIDAYDDARLSLPLRLSLLALGASAASMTMA